MSFSEEEIEWIKLAVENNSDYRVTVDNDCIYIDKNVNEETDERECVFTFNSFGEDFIVNLLNYIGCNAEYC